MSDGFQLVPLRNGTWGIRSEQYAEVCHPGLGPGREAQTLYVEGVNLRDRLREVADRPGDEFIVWDVGLGGAANAVTILGAAREFAVRLRVISVDRSLAGLAFAVGHADQLGYFGDRLGAARQLLVSEEVHFDCGRAAVIWRRVVADFPVWLRGAPTAGVPSPHLILFDPHSPAVNPEMWTLGLFVDLAAALDPARGCLLATYSRSTAVRVALLLAGFHVGTGAGTGTKEETTVAANRPELIGARLGARWLERARRSGAAEPWTNPPYEGRPLTERTWERLRGCAQFSDAGMNVST